MHVVGRMGSGFHELWGVGTCGNCERTVGTKLWRDESLHQNRDMPGERGRVKE